MMKALKEILLIKDATINKVQFDKEWFFRLDDIAFYLKEDLSEVEFIYLPITIERDREFVKCSSFEEYIKRKKRI
jgi:hypothetical protein